MQENNVESKFERLSNDAFRLSIPDLARLYMLLEHMFVLRPAYVVHMRNIINDHELYDVAACPSPFF